LRLIKGLIRGSIVSEELESQIEIWIEEPGKGLFKNIKSNEIITRMELNHKKLGVRCLRIIMVDFSEVIKTF
jgi:hypothetical protein